MISKINFIIRFIVAVILLQSLYFKFSAHPQAVHIFSTLGVDPWGRYLLGGAELLIGLGLLIPKTAVLTLFSAIGLMIGAVMTHVFTPVGIVVEWDGNSDNGQLFAMAVTALVLSSVSLKLYTKIRNCSLKKLLLK